MDSHRNPKTESVPSGFTLVEMLVVIAIISILMTAGTIGLGGIEGKGVSSGVSSAEALFDEARTTAVARNLRSCVLVAKALDNNPSEDLRRIIVAYEATDPATGAAAKPNDAKPTWVLSSRGMVLPEQTFFSETLSKLDPDPDLNQPITLTDVKPNYVGKYFIYRFNGEGVCLAPGTSFVIGGGTRNTSLSSEVANAKPRVTARAKRDFGGFVIWRNGGTSLFRSPTQISDTLPDVGKEF